MLMFTFASSIPFELSFLGVITILPLLKFCFLLFCVDEIIFYLVLVKRYQLVIFRFSGIMQKGVDKVKVFRYVPICTTFQSNLHNNMRIDDEAVEIDRL